jgi:hypothetical protein
MSLIAISGGKIRLPMQVSWKFAIIGINYILVCQMMDETASR